MNTTTTTRGIQTISALSLALLISGTTCASHKLDAVQGELSTYENARQDAPNCISAQSGGTSLFRLGSRQVPLCIDAQRFDTPSPAPIRLAKPLSGSQPIRSGESIRYSF